MAESLAGYRGLCSTLLRLAWNGLHRGLVSFLPRDVFQGHVTSYKRLPGLVTLGSLAFPGCPHVSAGSGLLLLGIHPVLLLPSEWISSEANRIHSGPRRVPLHSSLLHFRFPGSADLPGMGAARPGSRSSPSDDGGYLAGRVMLASLGAGHLECPSCTRLLQADHAVVPPLRALCLQRRLYIRTLSGGIAPTTKGRLDSAAPRSLDCDGRSLVRDGPDPGLVGSL